MGSFLNRRNRGSVLMIALLMTNGVSSSLSRTRMTFAISGLMSFLSLMKDRNRMNSLSLVYSWTMHLK